MRDKKDVSNLRAMKHSHANRANYEHRSTCGAKRAHAEGIISGYLSHFKAIGNHF